MSVEAKVKSIIAEQLGVGVGDGTQPPTAGVQRVDRQPLGVRFSPRKEG